MRVYHGSPEFISRLKRGSFVTPFLHAARIWAVRWSSTELLSVDPNKVGEILRFKDKAVESHPIYLYTRKVDETQIEKAVTNMGSSYPYVFRTRLSLTFEQEEYWSDWKLVIPYMESEKRYL